MCFRAKGHAFLLIAGEWHICDDGVARPAVQAKVQGADGPFHFEIFLVDPGADRTVLSALRSSSWHFPLPLRPPE